MRADGDRFALPDLCSPLAVFAVVLGAELFALLLTLARQPGWWAFYEHLGQASLLVLWIALAGAALLCALRRQLCRLSVRAGSLATFGLLMLLVLVMSEAAWWLATALGLHDPAAASWRSAEHWSFISRNLAIGMLVTGPLLRYFYVSQQWQRNVRREAESRLSALQARIRPHFLFNSMNTIAALTRSNPRAAEQAVEDLADLFRASLNDARAQITLAEELEIARVYERMEAHRLGDRLHVAWELDELPLGVRVPSLIVQPLLENAIYHGIEPMPGPGTIEIRGRRDADCLRISVSNPLPPTSARNGRSGSQIALANIRERLALAFGARASLEAVEANGRFEVTLVFPAGQGQGPT